MSMDPVLTPRRLSPRNKLGRALWGLVHLILIRPSPRPAHGWRRLILRAFGARIGPACLIYPSARIWAPWNLTMGRAAVLGDGADCYNVARITLGDGAVVSQRAFLCAASHDHRRADFQLIAGQIRIGRGAWICAEAFVGPGLSVGDWAILGARSVAIRDIQPETIAAGNPARPVAPRLPQERCPGEVLSGAGRGDPLPPLAQTPTPAPAIPSNQT